MNQIPRLEELANATQQHLIDNLDWGHVGFAIDTGNFIAKTMDGTVKIILSKDLISTLEGKTKE